MRESKPRLLSVHVSKNGKCATRDWLNTLQDVKGKAAILGRLNRVRSGNFGDCARYGTIKEAWNDYQERKAEALASF